MDATVVDLRYRMNDVLKALDRNEEVVILYRGKAKGVLIPRGNRSHGRVSDHPFFGMCAGNRSVDAQMNKLRGSRYRDI